MRRGPWWPLVVALAVAAIGNAQQPLSDLGAAASSLLRQFEGDVATAREVVDRVAALPPDVLSAALDGAGVPGAIVPDALRLAGVPEPLLEDPAATLAAARFLVMDPSGAIDALNEATMAQAPPPDTSGPTPSAPTSPDAAPSSPDAAPTDPAPVDVEAAPEVSTAVTTESALGVATWIELGLVLVSWVAITWVFFFFFWRTFMAANPFLAVRLAYSISVVAVLAYLALVFWPKFFAFALPDDFGYLPYVAAGVLAILVMIGIWTSYRTEVDE
jgi:hypothetical protein